MYAAQHRFVKVAAPTLHAGIGDALREAFHPRARGNKDGDDTFARLLAKLG